MAVGWQATIVIYHLDISFNSINLRYREGSDQSVGYLPVSELEFQSTLPRRQRQQKCINTLTIFCI